jgi:Tfp pilus assembly protein PilF
LKSLIREYPQFIPARLKLGVIYYNMNNLAEATEQWENILLRDPHHPEALQNLKMANAAGITTISL